MVSSDAVDAWYLLMLSIEFSHQKSYEQHETGQRMLKLEESISAVENKVGLVLAKLDEDSKSRTQICTVLEMQVIPITH